MENLGDISKKKWRESWPRPILPNKVGCRGERQRESVRGFALDDTMATSEAERYVAGIDEAGRGPVLGPMVYAVAWCPKTYEQDLKREGFTDSKQLTPEKREALFAFMKRERKQQAPDRSDSGEKPGIGFALESLSAREIGGKMLDAKKCSLNEMAFESTCNIIREMLSCVPEERVETVFVDTLGDPARHRDKLKNVFPGLHFVVESKADLTYPVVSAAR